MSIGPFGRQQAILLDKTPNAVVQAHMLPGTALSHLRPSLQETEALGPAMTALKPRQRAFVILLWESQPISATQAYIRAGYTFNPESASTNASRLLQDVRIKKAIIEYGRAYSAKFAPELHAMLMSTALNPQHKDHAKVGLAMLKHTGFVEQIEQTMNLNITITRQEKIEAIRADLAADGLTPEQIEHELGSFAEHEVVDAEFTEVEKDPFANETY